MSIKINRIEIIFFVGILCASLYFVGLINAEQTATTRYLSSEPLTLMDLGIYRLDKLINEDLAGTAMVKFDWEENRIHIRVAIAEWDVKGGGSTNIKTKMEAYGRIRLVVNSIRDKLGIDPKTGEIASGETPLEACFKPVADRDKKIKPENIKADLFNMIDISVHFAGDNIKIVGSAQLKGTEISFDR